MKNILRSQAFLLPFAFIWVGLAVLQILYSQNTIILAVNRHWSPAADLFFKYFTHVGDGAFSLVIGVLALLYSYRISVGIVAGYVLSGIFVQLLKHFVFSDMHRPPRILADVLATLHKVPGVELYSNGTFPSGHTTSAFALFAILAFYCKSNIYKALLLIPALLVAYSRMYLLEHFLRDVFAGALTGIFFAGIVFIFLERTKFPIRGLLKAKETFSV